MVSVTVLVLVKLALRHMYATTSSADAERSFSLYNLVHSERRRSLGEGTISKLLFLYYNNFVGSDVFLDSDSESE